VREALEFNIHFGIVNWMPDLKSKELGLSAEAGFDFEIRFPGLCPGCRYAALLVGTFSSR
jgi:hypothetical protein